MSAIERIRKALNRPRMASTPLGPVVVIDPIVRREDLAELLAEMDRLRGLLCKCDMRTRLVGDGCEFCNPQLADELAKEQR